MPRRPGTHVDDPVSVGRRLREAREHAGLSQRQLSFEGCTPAYISRVEAGARIPSLQLLHELARRLGTTPEHLATGGEGRNLSFLLDEAEAATRLDELETATELYVRVLASDPVEREAAAARRGLAEIAFRRGEAQRVIELLSGAEAESLDAAARDWVTDRVARAHTQLGEYDLAIAGLTHGLEAAKERGDELAVLRFSTLLANTLLEAGDTHGAGVQLAEAKRLSERIADPIDLARIWWSQARLHIQQDRPGLAARYIRKTIDLLDANEHTGFAATAFQLLARIENDRGNHAAALDLVERGEPVATATGNRYHMALFELERARALAGSGEMEEAAAVAMRAAGLLEEASPPDAGRGYAVIAEVFRALGEADHARELYELASDRLADDDPFQVEIHTALGELLETNGHEREAMQAYKRAAQLRAKTATT